MQQSLVQYGDVSLNPCEGKVWREDTLVELTRNETRILQVLMEARGGIVTRESIIKSLWEDESFVDDNTLTVNVARLRKKLEQLGVAVIHRDPKRDRLFCEGKAVKQRILLAGYWANRGGWLLLAVCQFFLLPLVCWLYGCPCSPFCMLRL